MTQYYIYMIELNPNESINKNKKYYYIGKTNNLKNRLRNHYNLNRKSAKILKADEIADNTHTTKALKTVAEVYKIKGTNVDDSLSSKLENVFTATKIFENKSENTQYRGGFYLDSWSDTFNKDDLEKLQSDDQLKEYLLEEIDVTNISLTSLEDLKTTVKKAANNDIINSISFEQYAHNLLE